jgi:hypothetical protein
MRGKMDLLACVFRSVQQRKLPLFDDQRNDATIEKTKRRRKDGVKKHER